mmetsp:Transcript_29212/g.72879  ORF Transcript_29212/g.72879 Transcript_29212/m.72879 type:complete len:293 (-) Transcript_29212:84-962(-)
MLSLQEDVRVLRHVGREGVDRAAIVDDHKEDRQVLLGRRVEALRHPPVLRAALAAEDDGHAVVALRRDAQVPVQQDGARGAHRVRQLLRDESPAALEVRLLVVDVHRPARPAARARVLGEELGHHRAGRHAARERVRVLAVVRVLDVAALDRVGHEGGDRLLAVVQVHEATDVALHVRLVARVLELAAELHHLVRLEEVLRLDHVVSLQLLLRDAKLDLEARAEVRPVDGGARAHLGVRDVALRPDGARGEVDSLCAASSGEEWRRGGAELQLQARLHGGLEGVRTRGEERR